MIIFGSNAAHLVSVESKTTTCPSCNTQGSIVLSVFRKHAHFFWIPIFPIGKKGISHCEHCKNVLESSEMPEQIRIESETLKNETKGPLWQFTGVGLFILMLIVGTCVGAKAEKLELQYIAAPKIGDVYKYKIGRRSYSTLKVTSVTKDSVYVCENIYEVSRASKIHRINESQNYTDWSYGISRITLKNMHSSGEIIDVNR